jgi:hypothetical protein
MGNNQQQQASSVWIISYLYIRHLMIAASAAWPAQ